MKLMNARYRGKCAGTGRTIHVGDEIAYDKATRKAYGVGTPEHSKAKGLTGSKRTEPDLLTAMQDEANDRWYAANYPNG